MFFGSSYSFSDAKLLAVYLWIVDQARGLRKWFAHSILTEFWKLTCLLDWLKKIH